MEMQKHIHKKLDILTKIISLGLVAVGIDYITKLDLALAMFYISAGALFSITPYLIKVKEDNVPK